MFSGDSGYALRPWCLTPICNPQENTPEDKFNITFKKARVTIERCNGVLKGRFRCLLKDRVLHYTPEKASKIINACCVLHNICVKDNLEDPVLNEILDADALGTIVSEPVDVIETRLLSLGRAKRAHIVRNYFSSRS